MEQHGLVHPPHLLDQLPVLHDNNPNNTPIRVLSPSQFAAIHLQHTLAHPPDNVLFPFLHGLEGDNHAQNTFFATSAYSTAAGTGSGGKGAPGTRHAYAPHQGNNITRITPKVPPYRGLVWVVCEDDLEQAGDQATLRILRRKPASATSPLDPASVSSQPFGLDDQSLPSSSSEEEEEEDDMLEDDMSIYDDDEEGMAEGGGGLNEDQREVLLMARAQDAVDAAEMNVVKNGAESNVGSNTEANASTCALPATSSPTTTSPASDNVASPNTSAGIKTVSTAASCAAARRQSSASTSTTTSISTSPGLDTDHDPDPDEEEDFESVLASPVHIPLNMDMQLDTVHVVQPSDEDDTAGDAEGRILHHDAAAGADDTPQTNLDVKLKKEESFEGAHMHPVAHRPTPTLSTSGVGVSVVGLGITSAATTPSTPSSSTSSRSPSTSSSEGMELDNNSASSCSSPCEVTEPSSRSPSEGCHLTEPSPESSKPPSQQLPHPHQNSNQLQPTHPENQPHPHPRHLHLKRKKPSNPAEPPLFTSTFRPKELLRRTKGAKLHIVTDATSSTSLTSASASGSVSGGLSPPVYGSGSKGGFGHVPAPGSGEARGREEGGGGDLNVDDDEKGWEFVPARVPDGISLRNFGIQVPIYATLSDIVVYSPFGATPAAISLARRFRTAIRAKRLERLQAAGLGSDEEDEDDEDQPLDDTHDNNTHNEDTQITNDQERLEREERRRMRREFLRYNVFVLDAVEEEMRKSVPYLMMRICGAGVPGGPAPHAGPKAACSGLMLEKEHHETECEGASGCCLDIGAHTDGPDGHTIELDAVEEAEARKKRGAEDAAMDMVADMELDQGEAMDVDVDPQQASSSSSTLHAEKKKGRPRQHRDEDEDDVHLIPNTVDFALREREEMRDLTKASEIISLYPLPSAVPSLSAAAIAATSSTPYAPASGSISTSTPTFIAKSTRPSSSAIFYDPERDGPPVWDPRVGQVFLGNSGDVPLAPDVPSHFRHAASVPRDADEAARWDWEALTGHLRGVDGLMKQYGLDGDRVAQEEATADESRHFKHKGARGKPKANRDLSGVSEDDPFNYVATNDPARGYGYDICVECHDLAPFPSTAHLRAADEHLGMLDVMWRERWEKAWMAKEERRVRREGQMEDSNHLDDDNKNAKIPSSWIKPPPPAPPRPPPHANAVIHLPFPSSPSNSQATMVALMPVLRFLEKWIQPVPLPVPVVQPPPASPTPSQTELKNLRIIESVDPQKSAAGVLASPPVAQATPTPSRRWSSVTSLMPSFPSFASLGGASHHDSKDKEQQEQHHGAASTPPPAAPLPPHPTRIRSATSPSFQRAQPPTPVQARTRPLKILLYSSDGYTESSVPALCLLMAIKALMLPEAYLELQVEKRRSFFVYQADLGVLKRVESRLREEREREKEKERERERERERMAAGVYLSSMGGGSGSSVINANGKRTAPAPVPTSISDPPASRVGGVFGSSPSLQSVTPAAAAASPAHPSPSRSPSFMGRPAAKSVSFTHGFPPAMSSSSQYMQGSQVQPAPAPMVVPSLIGHTQSHHHPLTQSGTWPAPSHGTMTQQIGFSTSAQVQYPAEFGGVGVNGLSTTQQPQPQQPMTMGGGMMIKRRPRASTSPWLPSLFGGDHQSWFNDPRFDGSFPSRVLPFLYLGNLNHASNVYMLHALGITHVVSVGECALVPPPHHLPVHVGGSGTSGYRPPGSSSGAHFVPGKGPGAHGSLWIEEREGRIKVLDIKGVCDDGIDTLEPQLEPICDWIDKARQDGGQVLVHCRVGVSRSATVTIAYVMKHLELPLVDAYLIVRSRRLSVLIQPNMRLLYNLCGWEIKLAKERANGDERKLKKELARTLTWPYLAKEVHALNEKYLH